jgi:hypothetical protein
MTQCLRFHGDGSRVRDARSHEGCQVILDTKTNDRATLFVSRTKVPFWVSASENPEKTSAELPARAKPYWAATGETPGAALVLSGDFDTTESLDQLRFCLI